MRIASVCVLLGAVAAARRPAGADADEPARGKRQLPGGAPVSVSHYYNSGPLGGPPAPAPAAPAARRISTGTHHPHYPPQFFPGPPVRTHHRKGRPQPPPYAVPMEPPAHYSQPDPLYGTNVLSPNADATHHPRRPEDPLADTDNHLTENIERGGTIYVPHRPHVIEKPVYIKEPEPIIEIIIKESNVTLPPPPTTPPPKKKKEEVQVFYVKYKKNPYGSGKDSIVYDKPVPAISPQVPDDEEEQQQQEEEQGYNYNEVVTHPPPPSTTLRTIIKPDSEVYHSPSGIKVTFGKEGFDYDKRSSKPEDYQPLQQPHPTQEPAGSVPQARQLSSFSNTYFNRPIPPPSFFQTLKNVFRPDPPRTPQPYKPFNFPPPPPNFNSRPPSRPSGPPPQQPPPAANKYPFQSPPYVKPASNNQHPGFFSSGPSSNKPPFPAFSHTISHPPPHFQSNGPPPQQYQPNPNYHTIPQDLVNDQPVAQQSRPSSQPQFNPHPPQFNEQPKQRQPVPYKPFENFNPAQPAPPQYSQPPTSPSSSHLSLPQTRNPIQFRPETHFPVQQQLPLQQQNYVFNGQLKNNNLNEGTSQQQQQNHQLREHQQQFVQQNSNQQSQISQNEHLNNLHTAQSILPAGGELIHSLPKFEQHLVINSNGHPQQVQQSSDTQYQQESVQHSNANQRLPQSHQQQQQQQQQPQQQQQSLFNHEEYEKIQQQLLNSQENTQRLPQSKYQSLQFSEQRSNDHVYASPRSTTQKSVSHGPTKRIYQSTTERTTTTATAAPTPSTTTKDPKVLEAQLPDEVPDDLRAQLLSSGILNNADISILDYDKVGDIPLSALPPDQLANFYNAGGAQQLSGAASEPIPKIVAQPLVRERAEEDQEQTAEASEVQEVRVKPDVEMKVVRYNPETEKGQQVQEAYVADDAKQVDPVVLNDNTYNRYLPLKVNGTQFPIPDVPELKGKKISSVVVLAPVAYDFSSVRQTREAKETPDLELIQEQSLKELLVHPTAENYNKFLESQNKTDAAKQSVILLVTEETEDAKEKEIFMYDIATKSVNKLNGELSAAFVDAAEANSGNEEPKDSVVDASDIVESRISYAKNADRENPDPENGDLEDSASDKVESKVFATRSGDEDLSPESSELLETIENISGHPLKADFSDLNSVEDDVLISSGYRKTGSS